MPRFILSVREECRVQYEVVADNEIEARKKYEQGNLDDCKMLTYENDAGDIVDVTELPA